MFESPLAHDGKMNALCSHILIPFLLNKEARAFLEPIPDEAMELKKLKDIFPVHPETRPPIFRENDLALSPSYKTVRIFCSVPIASQYYISWLTKAEKVKCDFWK